MPKQLGSAARKVVKGEIAKLDQHANAIIKLNKQNARLLVSMGATLDKKQRKDRKANPEELTKDFLDAMKVYTSASKACSAEWRAIEETQAADDLTNEEIADALEDAALARLDEMTPADFAALMKRREEGAS